MLQYVERIIEIDERIERIAGGVFKPVFMADTVVQAGVSFCLITQALELFQQCAMACAERGIPLIAVDNPCLLEVTAEALGLEVIAASSYSEAAGLVLALREGIAPAALRRPLPPLRLQD